jgi:hypothetical protein
MTRAAIVVPGEPPDVILGRGKGPHAPPPVPDWIPFPSGGFAASGRG